MVNTPAEAKACRSPEAMIVSPTQVSMNNKEENCNAELRWQKNFAAVLKEDNR